MGRGRGRADREQAKPKGWMRGREDGQGLTASLAGMAATPACRRGGRNAQEEEEKRKKKKKTRKKTRRMDSRRGRYGWGVRTDGSRREAKGDGSWRERESVCVGVEERGGWVVCGRRVCALGGQIRPVDVLGGRAPCVDFWGYAVSPATHRCRSPARDGPTSASLNLVRRWYCKRHKQAEAGQRRWAVLALAHARRSSTSAIPIEGGQSTASHMPSHGCLLGTWDSPKAVSARRPDKVSHPPAAGTGTASKRLVDRQTTGD